MPTDLPTDPPTDLAGRIDRSFGAGPEPFPDVEALLARGRRTRRRRRAGGGAAAAVLVVAGFALAQPGWTGLDRGSDVDVSSPSSTATALPTATVTSTPTIRPMTAAEREELRGLAERAVTFEGDGHVRLPPGASVVRSMADPFGT